MKRIWNAAATGLFLGLAVMAGPVIAASDWVEVPDDGMAAALVARTVQFADGSNWGFFADGRVLSGEVWGRWSQGDETVCLLWPGAEADCYRLEIRDIDLRFTPVSGGTARVARYIDL
jgi:hypothetical protein